MSYQSSEKAIFLRNSDIAKKYNVTKPTVTRWFDLAKDNKNNLKLILYNKILKISNTESNHLEIGRAHV